MVLLPIFLSLVSGICFASCLLSFFIAWNGLDRELYLAFGGLGFINAISTLLAAIAYQISDIAIHQFLFNIVFSMQMLSGACLVLFVANYTHFKPMKLPYLISMGYVIGLVIFRWQALLLNNGAANKIVESELPWGETISILAQTTDNLQNPVYLLDLTLNGFNLFACYRHFRKGHRQSAIFLGIGLIFFLLIYIHTLLVDIGLLKTFYILEFSYLPLVLIINAQIVSRILQLAIVQQALKTSEQRWGSLVESVNLVIISRDPQAQTQYVNPYFSRLTGFQLEEIKGHSWFESMSPPADRVQQTKDFWSLFQGHGSLRTQSRLMTKTTDILTLEWSHVPIYNRDGAIVEFVSIGADITQRLKAEEELAIYRHSLEDLVAERTTKLEEANQALRQQQKLLERRHYVVETLADLLRQLNSGQPTEVILKQSLAHTKLLLNATDCFLYSFEAERQLWQAIRPDNSLVDISSLDISASVIAGLSEVTTSHRLTIITDKGGIQLIVPLVKNKIIYGAMILLYPDVPTAEEEQLAVALSNQLVLALETAHLRTQAKEAATQAERNRLAHDLHDCVTQTLFLINNIAGFLPDLLERYPSKVLSQLALLQRLSQGALAEMRGLLLELRPETLLKHPLGSLLKQLGKAAMTRGNLQIQTEIIGERRWPAEIQIALYRITQEALNNAIKHSDATCVTITLVCNSDQIVLSIIDDGKGFNLQTEYNETMGLNIMAERATAIGADLKIDSEPGQGTLIEVSLSLPSIIH